MFYGATIWKLLALGALALASCSQVEPTVEINGIAVPPVPALNAAEIAQGESLYQRECASCHGSNLEGQPNWKRRDADGNLPTPPHDGSGHTWHHSDEELIAVILQGGEVYDGTMPSFDGKLSLTDVDALLAYIKSYWEKEDREFQRLPSQINRHQHLFL